MSIKSGRYIITHAQHWNLAFLSDANDGTSLLGCLEQDVPGEEWNIKELRNGRYSIVNFGYKTSASAVFQAQKGEDVVSRERGSVWLIKEHGSEGKYTIATADDKLRWCLEDSWPETPITLHNAPPSDQRCLWTFQKIGRISTTPFGAAKEEMAGLKAELARRTTEVEVAKREAAQSNEDASRKAEELEAAKRELAQAKSEVVSTLAELKAAENAARKKEAEFDASMKAVEVEVAKQEAAQSNEDASRKAEELEAAKRELVQAKSEVVSTLAELEAARQEAAAAKAGAAENAARKEEAEVEVSMKAIEVEVAKRDAAHAKEEVEKYKPSFKYYVKMASQLQTGQITVTNVSNYENVPPIQAALFWAVQNGDDAEVPLLLEQEGVDVNYKSKDGKTPLLLASYYGYDEVVRLLLKKEGVDVNSKDKDGWTPLYAATLRGHDTVVRLLLVQEGVDADARSNDGQTPLMWAKKYKHKKVARLLSDKIWEMGNRK